MLAHNGNRTHDPRIREQTPYPQATRSDDNKGLNINVLPVLFIYI